MDPGKDVIARWRGRIAEQRSGSLPATDVAKAIRIKLLNQAVYAGTGSDLSLTGRISTARVSQI
jgi:hypothetical protein